jgi:hypothetical protein
MEKVRSMNAGLVSFVLSRGFGVPISGKRAKLTELVLARYSVAGVVEYLELNARRDAIAEERSNQRRLATQARNHALQERRRVARALIEEDDQLNELIVLINRFDYVEAVRLLPSHSSYSNSFDYLNSVAPRQTIGIMMHFVEKLLNTIYQLETGRSSNLPESTRQREINSRLKEMLNSGDRVESALRDASTRCNIRFTQSGIVHMTRLAKMYNYRRMLQADQTYYTYLVPTLPTHKVQMKTLNIRVVLVVANEEDKVQPVCGVCFDDLTALNTVMTGCNHAFCSDCIGGFARTRGIKSFINCPCCRTEIEELSVSCMKEHTAVIAGLAPVVA